MTSGSWIGRYESMNIDMHWPIIVDSFNPQPQARNQLECLACGCGSNDRDAFMVARRVIVNLEWL